MANPTRTRRSPSAGTGRFARSTTTSRPRPRARPRRASTAQQRTAGRSWRPRGRAQQQSGLKRALSGAAGALPSVGKSASAGKGGKGKAGGLALLAGAAGLAFKNRDRLTSMVRDRSQSDEPAPPAVSAGAPTATNTAARETPQS